MLNENNFSPVFESIIQMMKELNSKAEKINKYLPYSKMMFRKMG